MDDYDRMSSALAQALTERYSTSFSAASRLFDDKIRSDIYDIYGLVRVADEIVDTYPGADRERLLNDLETETYAAIERGFSTNPIVHAFARTASCFKIDRTLVEPFFESMRQDLTPRRYDAVTLQTYIHGSAEVVGLMCLKIFCNGDQDSYERLKPGAQRLGAAYQKVNFLRDIADDFQRLGRYYFVGSDFEHFDDETKQSIIAEIELDFEAARPYISALPSEARRAVALSYHYYWALLTMLSETPAGTLKRRRIRLNRAEKLKIYMSVRLGIAR